MVKVNQLDKIIFNNGTYDVQQNITNFSTTMLVEELLHLITLLRTCKYLFSHSRI